MHEENSKVKQETASSFLVKLLCGKAVRGPPLLVVLCGPSHSGKTTFANKLKANFKVVSSDKIRNSLSVGFGGQESESRVWEIFESEKRKALEEGRNIVLDACHLSQQARWHAVQGPNQDYEKICVVFDLPWPVLRERCLRTKRVSLAEVERMWKAFQDNKATSKELKWLGFDEVYYGFDIPDRATDNPAS